MTPKGGEILIGSQAAKEVTTSEFVHGHGHVICSGCGTPLTFDHTQRLPRCPECGGTHFRRASLFEEREPAPDTERFESVSEEPPPWLERARQQAVSGEPALAIEWHGAPRLIEIPEGWSRIGRSGASDIRLDDPTISRRHAVLVRTESGELRILDDRSLNGVVVNGQRTDWSPLSDGDELVIGRYRLFVVNR